MRAFSVILIFLITTLNSVAQDQEKQYYLGHHAASAEFSFRIYGIQANYHYIFKPKAKLMWIATAGVGYAPYQTYHDYYNFGFDLAYGAKNRVFLGLNAYFNAGYTDSRFINLDLGYLLYGKKHLFFTTTASLSYDPNCNCPDFSPFVMDLLVSGGWKF